MTLIKNSNYNSIKLVIINFILLILFSFSILPNLSIAAPTFSINATKLNLAQPGLNDMVTADLNQDGNMDVIISEYNRSGVAAVEIRLGDNAGTGLFNNTVTLARPGGTGGDGLFFNPDGLAVGDVDGDQTLDVAVTAGLTPQSGNPKDKTHLQTYIFKGLISGAGLNKKYALIPDNPVILETTSPPHRVAIADINNDSFADVIIAHSNGLSLFVGRGAGVFAAEKIISRSINKTANKIIVEYMNADLFLDIVTDREILYNDNTAANVVKPNTFTRKLSLGTGNLSKATLVAITVGDFNNDKLMDVAYALNYKSTNASELIVRQATSNGTYLQNNSPKIQSSIISDISVGDIDLDGKIDVLMLDNFKDSVHIFTGKGDGTFNLPIPIFIYASAKPVFLLVTKANNDRFPDIITANNANIQNPTLSVLLQNAPAKEVIAFDKLSITTLKPSIKFNLAVGISRKYFVTPAPSVTVSYTVNNGIAINGVDFNAPTGKTALIFSVGQVSQTINIEILPTVKNKAVLDFSITLTDKAGLVLGNEAVTISVVDPSIELPLITFSSTSFERNEDPGLVNMFVTVTRTLPATFPANTSTSVYLSTQKLTGAGSANPNEDYVPIVAANLTAPNLVFKNNQTSIKLDVPIEIINDAIPEQIEQFGIVLSRPKNGVLGVNANVARVIIKDNDIAAPVNNKPFAQRDTYIAKKNILLVKDVFQGVLNNDTDADITVAKDIFKSLNVRLAAGSTLAGLTLASNGAFTYKHSTPNFTGTVTFQYIVNDGIDDSLLPATVTINILNNKPVANNDVYSIAKDSKQITLGNVISNDSDDNNDVLTVRLVQNTIQTTDTLNLNSDGSFSYKPTPGFIGIVSFQYVINDGTEDSLPATVKISVYDSTQIKFGIFSFDTKNTYTVSEKTGELVLNVTRNSGQTGSVTLNYSITGKPAIEGVDFIDKTPTPKTLIFADGVTSMPITIGIVKDLKFEGDERFLISLTSVNLGLLANSETSSYVTITDSNSASSTTAAGGGGGGGSCTLQAGSRFDPVLPMLLLFALFYFRRGIKISVRHAIQ